MPGATDTLTPPPFVAVRDPWSSVEPQRRVVAPDGGMRTTFGTLGSIAPKPGAALIIAKNAAGDAIVPGPGVRRSGELAVLIDRSVAPCIAKDMRLHRGDRRSVLVAAGLEDASGAVPPDAIAWRRTQAQRHADGSVGIYDADRLIGIIARVGGGATIGGAIIRSRPIAEAARRSGADAVHAPGTDGIGSLATLLVVADAAAFLAGIAAMDGPAAAIRAAAALIERRDAKYI